MFTELFNINMKRKKYCEINNVNQLLQTSKDSKEACEELMWNGYKATDKPTGCESRFYNNLNNY